MGHQWDNGDVFLDEELEFDPQVYDMYHRAMMDWSCLSFDILPDQFGNVRGYMYHDCITVCIFRIGKCIHILYMLLLEHKQKREMGKSMV